MARTVKKHGLVCPWNWQQISIWLLILFTMGTTYGVVLPLLSTPVQVRCIQIPFGIGFSLSFGAALITGAATTLSDPTDLQVYGGKPKPSTSGLRAYCSICKSNVDLTSKHCGQCNRCVDEFDHHCRWLNNCVGRKNYKSFICLISSLLVAQCLSIAFSVLILKSAFCDVKEFEASLENLYHNTNRGGVVAVLILDLVASCAQAGMSFQLIILHIWLKYKGMTTYEYIINRRSLRKHKRIGSEQTGECESVPFYNKTTPVIQVQSVESLVQALEKEQSSGSYQQSTDHFTKPNFSPSASLATPQI